MNDLPLGVLILNKNQEDNEFVEIFKNKHYSEHLENNALKTFLYQESK